MRFLAKKPLNLDVDLILAERFSLLWLRPISDFCFENGEKFTSAQKPKWRKIHVDGFKIHVGFKNDSYLPSKISKIKFFREICPTPEPGRRILITSDLRLKKASIQPSFCLP